MALKHTISEHMKLAMKSRDKIRLETLRTLQAALMEREIELRGTGKGITPDDEVAVLTGAVKRRKESIEQFERGGRKDLVDQETSELRIIQEYLPRQMSREEVTEAIRQVIIAAGASGPSDFGKVMPAAMKQLKGRTDGKLVQEIVKELLG